MSRSRPPLAARRALRVLVCALLTGGRARVTDRHRALAQAWLDERADDSAAYREFGGRSGAYTPPQTRSGSAYGPVGSEM